MRAYPRCLPPPRPEMRAAVIALVLSAGQGAADPVVTAHGDWVSVTGEGACYLRNALLDPRDRVVLASVMLSPDGDGAILAAEFPSGAALTVPPALRLPDGTVQALAWQSCRPDTCSAVAILPKATIAPILAADEALLAYRPLPESPPLVLTLGLGGITAAWADLAGCGTP